MKIAVDLNNIGKKYPARKHAEDESNFWALHNVSFSVNEGQAVGIIGRNGAGKTTLLNIIAGTTTPTEGRLSASGKVLGLFNLGVGFQDELTGKENIFLNGAILGATHKELNDCFDDIVEFSELGDFINMPIGTYSQGMRLRLGFSILAHIDFDILVIDEVLAVGDTVFQNKCFQRLMDLRRMGKTLIITSQDMNLVERICDKIIVLNHGVKIFEGNSQEAVKCYRELLQSEEFYVGLPKKRRRLFENTKKWAEDIEDWGAELGTKEATIESVKILDRFGRAKTALRSGESFRVRISFKAHNSIKNPHFGIAFFRHNGAYCYGPNTYFDDCHIKHLEEGKGEFAFYCKRLPLATGHYRMSVAIWDRNERVSYDYHNGCYPFIVNGHNNKFGEMANINIKIKKSHPFFFGKKIKDDIDLEKISQYWEKKYEIGGLKVKSVNMLNALGQKKDKFYTNEPVMISVQFSQSTKKKYIAYLGIYRDDEVYCQGVVAPISRVGQAQLTFSKFPFLPGKYRISLGLWDKKLKRFDLVHHGVYPFSMVFNHGDHGTVYMDHSWKVDINGKTKTLR